MLKVLAYVLEFAQFYDYIQSSFFGMHTCVWGGGEGGHSQAAVLKSLSTLNKEENLTKSYRINIASIFFSNNDFINTIIL